MNIIIQNRSGLEAKISGRFKLEDVSAYLLNSRRFRFAYISGLPDEKRPGFGSSDPGGSASAVIQTRSRWPSSSRLGPRADRPDRGGRGPRGSVRVLVGLLHRDSGPEQTARMRRPSGQCPGRPTSSGLGSRPGSSADVFRCWPQISSEGLFQLVP